MLITLDNLDVILSNFSKDPKTWPDKITVNGHGLTELRHKAEELHWHHFASSLAERLVPPIMGVPVECAPLQKDKFILHYEKQ